MTRTLLACQLLSPYSRIPYVYIFLMGLGIVLVSFIVDEIETRESTRRISPQDLRRDDAMPVSSRHFCSHSTLAI
jgi:hypothetical protein